MARQWVAPLLGEERAIRRTNRVLPQTRTRRDPHADNDEVITTARPSNADQNASNQSTPQSATPPETPTPEGETQSGSGMVRQWMTELTGAARPRAAGGGTVRVPSDAEIQILTGMFPDIARDVLLGVLQRRYVLSSFCFWLNYILGNYGHCGEMDPFFVCSLLFSWTSASDNPITTARISKPPRRLCSALNHIRKATNTHGSVSNISDLIILAMHPPIT